MMKKDDSTREYWNGRAADFRKSTSIYEEAFLSMACLREGESVFDMGCGPGTLSVPLAKEGHKVLACDFSEEMIRLLKEEADEKNLSSLIDAKVLDWNEDWEGKEIYPCDVAIASRSLMAENLEDALLKLDSMAERKVIITSPAKTSRTCPEAAEYMGIDIEDRYLKVLDALDRLDIPYTCDFLDLGEKDAVYDSQEDCFKKIRRGFDELTSAQEESLRSFIKDRYEDGRLQSSWPVRWAFIWWEK